MFVEDIFSWSGRGTVGLWQLLRECSHDNIVRLVKVHINHYDMSLYLAFDYAEHDLYEIIRHHREKVGLPIKEYTVKSLLWQILNGLNYLHSNWIIHRDLKPSNILVTGNDGEEPGVVKIGDFGLARIFQAPLKPLWDNGVVVTIWYRSPELLLGSKHYTCAVDMWAVGCIFAELVTLKPLFQGVEDKGMPNPFQVDQLDKIFRVLGSPTVDRWPALQHLSNWLSNRQSIQTRRYEAASLSAVLQLPPKSAALNLLSRMLEYDPLKRISAAEALDHEYFHLDPLPGKNALVGGHVGEKLVAYPRRPVDLSSDFEGSQTVPSGQGGSGSGSKAGGHPSLAAQHRHGAAAPSLLGPLPGGAAAVQMRQSSQQQARMKERSMSHASHQPPSKTRRI